MKRRAVLAGIAAILAPRPLMAQTPAQDGPRRLGVLMGNLADDPVAQTYVAALMQGLRALDWQEGQTCAIDWRWTGGDPALFDRYAAELVALGPDVLLAQSSPSVDRRCGGIPARSRSCSRWSPIRSARALSKTWRVRRQRHRLQRFQRADGRQMAGDAGAGRAAGRTRGRSVQSRDRALCRPDDASHRRSGAFLRHRGTKRAVPRRPEIESVIAELARQQRGGLLVLTDIFTIVHRDTILASAARHRLPPSISRARSPWPAA